jgi:lipoate-protein ligase A
MIQTLYIHNTWNTDPYQNIALEKYILDHLNPGDCVLYLWQNKNTVVIGRNQNAWAECRTTLLEQEGGKMARRLSGGGAVFHDMGNLNFTFLLKDEDYDVDKQLSVIQTALAGLGLHAEKSGRNDLLVEGRKFSGNAFYHRNGNAYHHGTLLVSADMEKLSRYLTPPKAKLEAKGVASVRSRVANLTEFVPELTCDQLRKFMTKAFTEVYGLPCCELVLNQEAADEINATAEQLSGWEWLFGSRLPFSFSCEGKFDWGWIQLQLQVESGQVLEAQVYSDAMDWELPDAVSNCLKGCKFSQADLCQAIQKNITDTTVAADLCKLIEEQSI